MSQDSDPVVKKVVGDLASCVKENAGYLKSDMDDLYNHFVNAYYISVLNDLGNLVKHCEDLLACFGIQPDSAKLADAMKKLDETDVLNCLFQYVPTLVEDISKIASAISSGDFSAVFAGVETLVADGQAFNTCLSQA